MALNGQFFAEAVAAGFDAAQCPVCFFRNVTAGISGSQIAAESEFRRAEPGIITTEMLYK